MPEPGTENSSPTKVFSPSPVEAWIGRRLDIDPTQLKLCSGSEGGLLYRHPEYEKIILKKDYLEVPRYPCVGVDGGFGTERFKAFEGGYTGEGEIPSDPMLRKAYDEGVDAQIKWAGGLEIEVNLEFDF